MWRWRSISAIVASGCWLADAGAAHPQVLPLGPEVQVNSYTTEWQSGPLVSAAPDGSFVIVWCCGNVEETLAIDAQRYDSGGLPIGSEFAMSQYDPDWPSDLSTDAAGNFVLVWGQGSAGCPDCDIDYVKGRRFTSDGTPRGDQFVISPAPGSAYTGYGSVATHADGGFVVVWYDYGLMGRRYDLDGAPLGAIFPIAGASDWAISSTVSSQPEQGFLIVWADLDPNWNYWLRGQRYDGTGLPTGGVITVVEPGPGYFDPESAAEPDGDFVVAWSWLSSPIFDTWARRFTASGTPLAPAWLVNSYTTGSQDEVIVEQEPGGGFVVVWTSDGSPGPDHSSLSVQGRRFAADGTPLGNQFQLNSYTTSYQGSPAITFASSGDLIAVWSSDGSYGTDSSSSSVQLRRFRVPFFIDGFESGDTSRWSVSQP